MTSVYQAVIGCFLIIMITEEVVNMHYFLQ